ncbi:hypothetical protein J2S00_001969 [Caldalkalibacillus uzonensis]|uniref:Uncharacterized protein n=1 Tax=Caldalkalibacillus uzonensis TaxID=353224 RepID=A0ABU0CSU9_9BACI|nr:hypothetical protein [Caldalkalibacillus uzonensis]
MVWETRNLKPGKQKPGFLFRLKWSKLIMHDIEMRDRALPNEDSQLALLLVLL